MFFIRLFLCFSCFFVSLNVNAEPQTQADKVKPLIKEVHTLTKSLKGFENKLDILSKKLEKIAPAEQVLPPSSQFSGYVFLFESIHKLSQHIKDRFSELSQGLQKLVDLFQEKHFTDFFIPQILLKFLLSAFIGVLSVYVGKFFIHLKLKNVLNVFPSQKISPLAKISLLGLFLALPLPFYFFISLGLAFFLDQTYFNTSFSKIGTYHYAFLPVLFYIFFASRLWIKIVYSPQRPSLGILSLTDKGAYQSAFWMRCVFWIFFVAELFLNFLETFVADPKISLAVSDFLGLLFGTTLIKALLKTKWSLKKDCPFYDQTFRSLNFLSFCVFIFSIFWVLDKKLFLNLLTPVLMSLILISTLQIFQFWIRYLKIQYLWKTRYRHTAFRKLIEKSSFISFFSYYATYTFLAFVWARYLWKAEEIQFWTLLQEGFKSLIANPFSTKILNALIVFACAILIVKAVEKLLAYYIEDKYPSESAENNFLASRLKTLLAMLKTFIRIVIWLPAISIIFSQFGDINISAWITSIGAASFGLSFGFQGIVRDFVTGFFIILENNLMVGDDVEVDSKKGKVEEITMRTLKIRSDSGMLLTIPFGSILVIGNKNRKFSAIVLNISVGYHENLDNVQIAIEKAYSALKRQPIIGRRVIGALEVRGINEVTSYSMVIQAKIKTMPNMQESVRRAYIRLLKQQFDEMQITVPIPPHTVFSSEPSLTNTKIQ